MGTLERPRAKRAARVVEVRWSGWPWAELGSVVLAWAKGWRRKHGKRCEKRPRKRHNLVNEGSSDYRVASNRDETGIRAGPRRTIRARGVEKGRIVKGRAALD